jgi:GNAT superfamily N-acetyltransferase
MITVRRGEIEDAVALAQLDYDTGIATYSGILPAKAMAERSTVEERIPRFQIRLTDPEMAVFVADDETQGIVGYVRAGLNRDGFAAYTGKIFAFYILESRQRQGIGRRLFTTAVDWLIANGHNSLCLQVYGELPSTAFYERLGGELIDYSKNESDIPTRVYGWSNLAASGLIAPRNATC